MKIKFRIVGVLLTALLAFGLVGCGGDEWTDTGEWGDAPIKELVYADSLPDSPQKISAETYAYDDLTQKLEVEIITNNMGVERPKDDPIENYVEKKYNLDMNLVTVNPGDMATTISTRFADMDFPDMVIIQAESIQLVVDLANAGLIMDARKALQYMPNTMQYVTEEYMQQVLVDDGTGTEIMSAIPRYPTQSSYNHFLRADWLKEFNMGIPKNLDELYEYAVKCKEVKGAYFMTGAGYGGVFGMMEGLKAAFGNPGLNVKDGKINNSILDGTDEAFLRFINKLIQNDLIDPDWQITTWEGAKAKWTTDKIGMVDYPARNLYGEYCAAKNDYTAATYEKWVPLPPMEETKKARPEPNISYLVVFPISMESQPTKVKRLAHFIDQVTYGGEDFYNLISGGGNDVWGEEVFVIDEMEDGRTSYYIDMSKHPYYNGEIATDALALSCWQNFGLVDLWMVTKDERYPEYAAYVQEKYDEVASYDRWEQINTTRFDTQKINTSSTFVATEFVKFAKGERSFSEWNVFKTDWLNDYCGRDVLNMAAEQMGVQGY